MKNNKQGFRKIQSLSLILGLVVLLFFANSARSQSLPTDKKTKASSSLNSQIYEKMDDSMSFQGSIKLLREMDSEVQVFFNEKPGFYQVPENGNLRSALSKAEKSKQTIGVTVDSTTRTILSIKDSE